LVAIRYSYSSANVRKKSSAENEPLENAREKMIKHAIQKKISEMLHYPRKIKNWLTDVSQFLYQKHVILHWA